MRVSMTLTALLAVTAATAPVLALAKPAPAAASAPRPDDPHYEPRTDLQSPEIDASYDPRDDPNHPAKAADDPGEAWDIPRRGDRTPSIRRAEGDWVWGELTYGRSYKTKLGITNQCASTETVTITAENCPISRCRPASPYRASRRARSSLRSPRRRRPRFR